MSSRRRELILFGCVAAVSFVLFFTRIGGGTLEKWDESLYGCAPRYMAHFGSWILPVDGEGKFWGWFGKPPLVAWVVAASTSIFGYTTFAMRAPFCLFSVGIVLVLYGFARRAVSPATGCLVPVIMAASPLWLGFGRTASVEIPLIFFIVLSLYLYSSAEERGLRRAALAGVALGAAILTKQIVASLALPAILALEAPALLARSFRPALRRLAVFGAAAIATSGWWFAYAYAQVGCVLFEQFYGFQVAWRLSQNDRDDGTAAFQGAGPATAGAVIALVGLWLLIQSGPGWARRAGLAFSAYLAASWLVIGNVNAHNHEWYYLHSATAIVFGIAALLGLHLRARDPAGWAAGLIAIGVILVDQVNRFLTATKTDHHLPVAIDVAVIVLAARFAVGALTPVRWRPRLPALDLGALAVCVAICITPTFASRPRADLELVAEALEAAPVEKIRIAPALRSDWSVFVSYLGPNLDFVETKGAPRVPGTVAYVSTKPNGLPGERKIGKYYLAVVAGGG